MSKISKLWIDYISLSKKDFLISINKLLSEGFFADKDIAISCLRRFETALEECKFYVKILTEIYPRIWDGGSYKILTQNDCEVIANNTKLWISHPYRRGEEKDILMSLTKLGLHQGQSLDFSRLKFDFPSSIKKFSREEKKEKKLATIESDLNYITGVITKLGDVPNKENFLKIFMSKKSIKDKEKLISVGMSMGVLNEFDISYFNGKLENKKKNDCYNTLVKEKVIPFYLTQRDLKNNLDIINSNYYILPKEKQNNLSPCLDILKIKEDNEVLFKGPLLDEVSPEKVFCVRDNESCVWYV
jgi:hypothetical protein